MPGPADCQLGAMHSPQQHTHQEADEDTDILTRLSAAQSICSSEGQLKGKGGCEADQGTSASCCLMKGGEVV